MTPEPPAEPVFPAEPTACIILAAGASRRLGQPKQTTVVHGRTLLENAVDAALATPGLWPVIVVVGAGAERLRTLLAAQPVLIVENPAWEEGLASSLRTGLDTALTFSRQIAAVVFSVCDQPALDASVFRALLERRAGRNCSAVASCHAGQAGVPALLHRRHFGQLAHLTGDEGARKLLQALPPDALELIDFPQLALDIDTPEDLARARAVGGAPNP